MLAKVSKGHDEMVAATIRTIFAQPGQAEVRDQVDLVAKMLDGQFPAVADMLLQAKADLTAFSDFPHAHWRKIWSTDPLSVIRPSDSTLQLAAQPRGQKTDRCRRVLPQPRRPAAFVELRTHIEAHDECQNSDRRYLSEESMALLNPPAPTAWSPKTPPPTRPPARIAATA